MSEQLALALQLDDQATFSNFYVADNIQLIEQLQQFIHADSDEQFIFLWGQKGTGRSHLLQACCHDVVEHQAPIMYLNLSEKYLSPAVLQGLESMQFICLDDLHAVIGDLKWEEQLFHFYNRVRDAGVRLLVSANVPPKQLSCVLPDLASRLSWGLVFQLHGLSDTQKLAALQFRAERRGLELPDEVGKFLLRYYPRDMAKLFAILEKLDQASLALQRRLTIPFVKKVLQ